MTGPALPLVAAPRRPGAACWLIGASCLVLILVAAAAIALGHGADRLAAVGADRLVIRVVEADPDRRDANARRVLAVLKARSDVAHARQLSTVETWRLIAAYLPDTPLDGLPLPVVIDATLAAAADRSIVRVSLARMPGVEVEPAAAGLAPLIRLVGVIRGIAATLGMAAVAAAALASALAARASIAANGAAISILHGLGATDRQIARAVHGVILRDAVIGAAGGMLLSLPLILLMAHRMAMLGPPWTEMLALDALGWVALALVPVALVVIVTGLAYAMIVGQLARIA